MSSRFIPRPPQVTVPGDAFCVICSQLPCMWSGCPQVQQTSIDCLASRCRRGPDGLDASDARCSLFCSCMTAPILLMFILLLLCLVNCTQLRKASATSLCSESLHHTRKLVDVTVEQFELRLVVRLARIGLCSSSRLRSRLVAIVKFTLVGSAMR